MIKKTDFAVAVEEINNAIATRHDLTESRELLNQPTGDFFYDPWIIKPEYKGSPWETILSSLKVTHGEARIVTMPSKTNYVCHSDIDDRYHLNLSGVLCFLVNLDNEKMYQTVKDGIWYHMDGSCRHSAVNFGNRFRQQLVVRQLLAPNKLKDPVSVQVVPTISDLEEARFIFDQTLSPLLNQANKQGLISNFKLINQIPNFECENSFLLDVKKKATEEFVIKVIG